MQLSREPIISVGIVRKAMITFQLKGRFYCRQQLVEAGTYVARCSNHKIQTDFALADTLELVPADELATFVLQQVKIGIDFHWEQEEAQEFEGILKLQPEQGEVRAVNRIPLEKYLKSVIASEMSAMNDLNLLKAHAIVSRSWLMAQLFKNQGYEPATEPQSTPDEIIKWYDREDHSSFDVCADDHCQRYQGISKIISKQAEAAVLTTRGQFLLYEGKICDARFSKCCGGITEAFETTWQAIKVPYLTPVIDAPVNNDLSKYMANDDWFTTSPEAYCNTSDPEVLNQVLIDFDRSTTNFFRWKVDLPGPYLSELLQRKSGIDFGEIIDLRPIERGQSGRISRLQIAGTKQSIVVGKELEIRKWLSESHLYSSAFIVEKLSSENPGSPTGFRLHGAGWGHGVGMCQIGAAVMSRKGFQYTDILQHYFRGAVVNKLYED
ncbi:MAG: SpoIID/LytB domain-containing protein [Prolixibacteraceae bacterium]|nr:SpoIID/LytB domain-containing protein [Prolixibacteraceae bacterium]